MVKWWDVILIIKLFFQRSGINMAMAIFNWSRSKENNLSVETVWMLILTCDWKLFSLWLMSSFMVTRASAWHGVLCWWLWLWFYSPISCSVSVRAVSLPPAALLAHQESSSVSACGLAPGTHTGGLRGHSDDGVINGLSWHNHRLGCHS